MQTTKTDMLLGWKGPKVLWTIVDYMLLGWKGPKVLWTIVDYIHRQFMRSIQGPYKLAHLLRGLMS